MVKILRKHLREIVKEVELSESIWITIWITVLNNLNQSKRTEICPLSRGT